MRISKEIFAYIIAGVLTTAVNWLVFYLCKFWIISPTVRNIIAWAVSVLFAYAANSRWVFKAKPANKKDEIKHLGEFTAARLFSGIVESAIIYIFIERLMLDEFSIKLAASIFVIIFNYLASKLWIFKKGG